MKIEIKKGKITIKSKWWHIALTIAIIILSFKAPEVASKLLQMYLPSG